MPANAVVGSYYVQAISKDAPHPAAARLWQEFLYSDEGQNLWLKGGARPVRADAMEKAGTIDKTAVRRAAEGRGHAGVPDRGADRQGQGVPGRQLGQGHRLTMADTVDTPDLVALQRPRSGHPAGPAGACASPRPAACSAPCRSSPTSTIFLVIPTLVVVIGAFAGDGGFTLANVRALTDSYILDAFGRSIAAVRGHRR